jgi:hypothetical protein
MGLKWVLSLLGMGEKKRAGEGVAERKWLLGKELAVWRRVDRLLSGRAFVVFLILAKLGRTRCFVMGAPVARAGGSPSEIERAG